MESQRVLGGWRAARAVLSALALLSAACGRYPDEPRYVLSVEPESLAFVARSGGLAPISRHLTLSSPTVLEWVAASDVQWLKLTVSSNGALGQVWVSPNPAGLALGTHVGTITVTAPAGTAAPASVTVHLEIVTVAPIAGRWLAAADAFRLTMDIVDSAGVVQGTGEVAGSGVPLVVLGTRTGDDVHLEFRAPDASVLVFDGVFFTDHAMRGNLGPAGSPGDSTYIFRQ